jgi:hypothetical protein
MSNWKNAYGWSGHILVSEAECESNPEHNVVAVQDDVFRRIVEDYNSGNLQIDIEAARLGVNSEDVIFLATGTGFSMGFDHFGTVFDEAELRALPGKRAIDIDAEYISAMKDVYGLDLPPCRLMIGCSSEH